MNANDKTSRRADKQSADRRPETMMLLPVAADGQNDEFMAQLKGIILLFYLSLSRSDKKELTLDHVQVNLYVGCCKYLLYYCYYGDYSDVSTWGSRYQITLYYLSVARLPRKIKA